jgi:hypothetical protein
MNEKFEQERKAFEEKFKVLKWGIDVAFHALTETNRIRALQETKILIDEVIAECEEIRKQQRESGLIP